MTGFSLVKYETMRRQLAECARLDEAAQMRDKAAALAAYARQRDDKELEAWVAEIKCRAVVRIGQLSRNIERAEAHGGEIWLPAGGKSKAAVLADAGISTSAAQRYEEIAEADKQQPTQAEEYYTACKANGIAPTLGGLRGALKLDRRAERETELGEATKRASQKIGQQLYSVIYADPPWRFEPYSRQTGMDRAADNHYPTMAVDEIMSLVIPAAEDCILFLWATAPMLPAALEVIKAWGFTYKSHCVWVKDRIGTGYWFRNLHELLLVATCGNVPAPPSNQRLPSVFNEPAGRHSEKPHWFAEMLEAWFPHSPKLEMFARQSRDGWDAWGNEAMEKD